MSSDKIINEETRIISRAVFREVFRQPTTPPRPPKVEIKTPTEQIRKENAWSNPPAIIRNAPPGMSRPPASAPIPIKPKKLDFTISYN